MKEKQENVRSPEASQVAEALPAATGAEVAAFLARARAVAPAAGGSGRLVFALDATMSRQPAWDAACRIQAEMFDAAAGVGGLEIQLLYYRGFGECRASRWIADGGTLRDVMTGIQCRGGQTQIGKVLGHVRKETGRRRVQALVFVGDAVEEDVDRLSAKAGELGLLGVPAFVFQEGRDARVEAAFREIARLTGGAYARFDAASARELAALLKAVAVFAAGGRKALARHGGAAPLLLGQMR